MSVNIDVIDRQHQYLIQLINDLHEAMKQGKANDISGPIIENLAQYAQDHFMTEEKLFFKHDYPQKQPHINEHNQFIDQVSNFKNAYDVGHATLSLDIMNFPITGC